MPIFICQEHIYIYSKCQAIKLHPPVCITSVVKAMDDIGVVMTPFGDVVTVSLVANSYVVGHVD